MKTECPAWVPPLLAVQFLTRLPVPAIARLPENAVRAGLGRAVGWFPLIGALVGTVTAGVLLLAEQVWSRIVAVIVALVVEALVTGAFHEDAVADFCDGIGGGRDPAQVRRIMRDSRIGSFGALGLTLAVALRAALMYSLSAAVLPLAIIAAATCGRLIAVLVMATTPPARDVHQQRHGRLSGGRPSRARGLATSVAGNLRGGDITLALLTSLPGLLPFALAAPLALLSGCVAAAVFVIWFRAIVLRRVGGSTGDCLGFATCIGQLVLLMAAVAW